MASNGIGEPIRKEVYLTDKGTEFIVFVFNNYALDFGILQYACALVDYRYSYNIITAIILIILCVLYNINLI